MSQTQVNEISSPLGSSAGLARLASRLSAVVGSAGVISTAGVVGAPLITMVTLASPRMLQSSVTERVTSWSPMDNSWTMHWVAPSPGGAEQSSPSRLDVQVAVQVSRASPPFETRP